MRAQRIDGAPPERRWVAVDRGQGRAAAGRSRRAALARLGHAATSERLLRIPTSFLADHIDRSLPAPHEVSSAAAYALILSGDPALPGLIDDAEYYCDPYGPGAGDPDYRGLRYAARALLKALQRQGAYSGNYRHGSGR